MTNLESILKSRDITLLTKVCLVKAMVFPVVMYGCESWTKKKTERWRIDAFELWCWRRLLRVPWTARRSNQSILKGISPEYSLEGLMLKLKLKYSGDIYEERTHWKRPWCWERLKARGEANNGGRDSWMASLTQWTWVWVNSRSWWWTGRPDVLQSMGSQRVRQDWATELNCATDGVTSRLERHKALTACLKKVYPEVLATHCALHWNKPIAKKNVCPLLYPSHSIIIKTNNNTVTPHTKNVTFGAPCCIHGVSKSRLGSKWSESCSVLPTLCDPMD